MQLIALKQFQNDLLYCQGVLAYFSSQIHAVDCVETLSYKLTYRYCIVKWYHSVPQLSPSMRLHSMSHTAYVLHYCNTVGWTWWD